MSTDYGLYAKRLEHYQIKFKRATLTLKAKNVSIYVSIEVRKTIKSEV